MQALINILLLVIALAITTISYTNLNQLALDFTSGTEQERETLYLPSGEGLEILSFGYKNLLSDILWFNTINYFGKHFKGDRNYTWLNHMCHLVIRLNPNANHVYKFCSTMLSWEANTPERSIKIMDVAIKNHPDSWEYYYLRGFTYMFFLENEELARRDLSTGAKLPNAPPFMATLAAKKMVSHDPNAAISFLTEMIKNSQDPSEQAVLKEKLLQIIYERDISNIKKALDIYEARKGTPAKSLDELVKAGIIGANLRSPYGKRYLLNPDTSEVTDRHKKIR